MVAVIVNKGCVLAILVCDYPTFGLQSEKGS